jgi:hypothetical protein
LRAPIKEILIGEREIARGRFGFPKLDKLIRLVKRQRLQQDGMNDGKIAVFAPMPSAIVSTAMIVKLGDLRSIRSAYLTS